MKSISRFDYGRNRGWLVRVRWQGRTHTKMFSDGIHGGRQAALEAATAWRDQTELDLGKPRTEATVQAKGETGGIWRALARNGHPIWVAAWPGGRTSFSVRLHGEREAKRLAREARDRGLAEFHATR